MGTNRREKVEGKGKKVRKRGTSGGGWKENADVPSGPDSLIDFDQNLREVLKENGPVRAIVTGKQIGRAHV